MEQILLSESQKQTSFPTNSTIHSPKKYALVLGGGGFRGAFQLGVIEEILENGFYDNNGVFIEKPNLSIISGVSVGALNGAFLAMQNLDGLKQLWNDVIEKGPQEIYHSDIVDIDGSIIKANVKGIKQKIFGMPIYRLALNYIFRRKKLMQKLKGNFDAIVSVVDSSPLNSTLKKNVKKSAFKIPFKMGIVSLIDGEYYSPEVNDFDTDTDLVNAVLASAALPIIFPYVDKMSFRNKGKKITLKSVTDGGVRNISPLNEVIEYIKKNDPNSDYHIIIVNCLANCEKHTAKDEHFNIASYALRVTSDLMSSEIQKNDFSNFTTINKIVKDALSQGVILKDENEVSLKYFDYTIFQPEDPNLPNSDLGSTMDASKEMLLFRKAYGKKIVQNTFKKTLSPLFEA